MLSKNLIVEEVGENKNKKFLLDHFPGKDSLPNRNLYVFSRKLSH
jgi:hypothetical protein